MNQLNDNRSLYNPDVLNTLSNLSNDEVFTPPDIVNKMLDLLPESIWIDKNVTFLDPASKSGVFMREITKRLILGLAEEFPVLEERLDHIFKKQLFGIAITELTSLLSRRSLYCSKFASGKYSVVKTETVDGNIRFKRVMHNWIDNKCLNCGASKKEFLRSEKLETHAYEFIHTRKPEEIFNMKFDVIIGNPPYQLTTNGSVESQATPIYNKFIEQAIKLNPRYISMITPSRWLNGGFGLDNFRENLLTDNRIRVIHDFLNSKDCFNGVEIKGGVSYFLWDRDNRGLCDVFTHKDSLNVNYSRRPLLEEGCNTFIRYSEAITILHKVKDFKETKFSNIVSPRDPFGLNYYENGKEIMFKRFSRDYKEGFVKVYSQGWKKDGINFTDKKYITTRFSAMDQYKIFISKAYGASETFPHQILNRPILGLPGTICNMTYLLIGEFNSEEIAKNVISYINTRFFRFLVSLLKNTQNAYKKVYDFVPMQDFNKSWSDEELYKKYNLNNEEILFIESMIRPMSEEEN